jgi:hypothetical protein
MHTIRPCPRHDLSLSAQKTIKKARHAAGFDDLFAGTDQ